MEARPKEDDEPSFVQFLDDGATEPTAPVRVTDELADLLVRAAEINAARSSRAFRVSFGSLFAAFTLHSDPRLAPTAAWVTAFAGETGADLTAATSLKAASLDEIAREPPDRKLLLSPLTRTASARRALEEALEIDRRAHPSERASPLDAAHLFGALLWLPDYHQGDFALMRVDVETWKRVFSEFAERQRPEEAAFWRALRSSAPDPGREPVSWLAGLTFSLAAREIVDTALELAGKEAQSSILSTRSLLASILDGAGASKGDDSSTWLLAALGEAVKQWPRVRAEYYPNGRLGAEPPARQVTDLTRDCVDVLKLAATMAMETTGDRPIQARHLIAALLVYGPPEPTNAHKLLVALGCDPASLRSALLTSLVEWGQDDGDAWRRRLAVAPTPVRSPDGQAVLQPNWALPRVANDRVQGFIEPDRDFLDAKRPALRFAKLLAARDVNPPIALGLFGNWGSGKTFFMGLMQHHVKVLTNGKDPDYVRRAAQIDFNAWHYEDTNLWASIAVRVFDGLARELAPKESEFEKKRRDLNQKIASSRGRKAEAEAQREAALKRRAEKAKELEEQLARRKERLEASDKIWRSAAWEVITGDPKTGEAVGETIKSLKALAGRLGLRDQLQTADDLVRLRKDLQDVSAKGQTLVTAVSARFRGRRVITTAGWLLGLVVVVAMVGWGAQWVSALMTAKNWPALPGASTLAQATTLLSAAVAWASTQLRRVSQAVDEATRLDGEIQRKVAEGSTPPKEQAAAESKIRDDVAELDREIIRSSEDLREADRQIAEATAEVERINQGGLVYDFLQERRTSTRYTNQLGLVSTIRHDFEKLGEMLAEFTASSSQPIERIILYIDDLDRCRPAKVVEVLQAVHLLLAFDIFHVVVGVDARWLRRSLEETYAGEKRASPPGEFSTHDYLEKIFQIPYALVPLQEDGFKALVDGMVQTRSEWKAAQARRRDEEQRKKDREADRAAHTPEDQERERGTATREGTPARPASEANGARAHAEMPAVEPTNNHPSRPPPSTSAAPVIFFEDHEERFIQGLHPFIDRPRLAGRFVNVYRLLRARAADENEDGTFAATADSIAYRVALLLLAINVGYPREAAKLFQDLMQTKKSSWREFLADEHAELADGAQRELLDRIERLALPVPDDIDTHRRWVRRVACFSFEPPTGLFAPASTPAAAAPHETPTAATVVPVAPDAMAQMAR
jgi:hypothetical protein